MPRAPRLHIANAIYFVTLEGPHRQPIFRGQADYEKYLELLKTYKAEFRFNLFGFTLLPNRIHLVIEPCEAYSISQIMQRLSPLYTKYFNDCYDRKGPLFQRRFRSALVEKEGYLARLVRYSHWLPVKLGQAQELGEYPYSSYGSMVNVTTGSGPVLLDLKDETKELLALISPKSLPSYMAEAAPQELKFLDQRLSRSVLLGSEAFVKDMRERIKETVQKDEPEPEPVTPSRALAFHEIVHHAAVPTFGVLALSIAGAALVLLMNREAKVPAAPMKSSIETRETVDLSKEVMTPAGAASIPNSSVALLPKSIQMPELNGTVWKIELISVARDGKEMPIEDKIQFVGPAFESYYFSNQGFSKSNYTVRIQKNGTITWETMQRNPRGETISWRGDWRGDKMEGVLSYKPAGGDQQVFSFFSQSAGVQK